MFHRTIGASGSLWPRLEMRYVGGTASTWAALAALLDAFESALRAVPGPQAGAIRSRIRGVAHREELLTLRGEVIDLVSRSVDPWLARSLMRELEELFEQCRAPAGRRAVA